MKAADRDALWRALYELAITLTEKRDNEWILSRKSASERLHQLAERFAALTPQHKRATVPR
jgi:hypothetical protein